MQFQSDILQANVIRPKITETTALGAAYLAGLATGFWKNADEISSQWQIDKVFSKCIDSKSRDNLVKGWNRAVHAAKAWSGDTE